MQDEHIVDGISDARPRIRFSCSVLFLRRLHGGAAERRPLWYARRRSVLPAALRAAAAASDRPPFAGSAARRLLRIGESVRRRAAAHRRPTTATAATLCAATNVTIARLRRVGSSPAASATAAPLATNDRRGRLGKGTEFLLQRSLRSQTKGPATET